MKFLHLSDLHLGKRVKEFPMLENQEYILDMILKITDTEKPDCVIIAGDVYDKSIPSTEAVQLFDKFLFSLYQRKLNVFVISGNHDSAERIAFGGRLMSLSGIYMSPVYNGKIQPVRLHDTFGAVNIYMLPFVKPVHIRKFYPDKEINTCTDALRTVIDNMNVDSGERNILIAHQFVTGASLSNSEEFSVGGTDNVDSDVFKIFDYTALGHIHRPQNVGSPAIRYCGSQLKYSLDEVSQQKSVTIAELNEKGNLRISEIPLVPKYDMKSYKGSYSQITDPEFYKNINTDDYIFITLTDETDIPDAVRKLQKIYPRMVQLSYDNRRTRNHSVIKSGIKNQDLSPAQIFSEFYESQCNHRMTDEQLSFVNNLIQKVWEEEIL
ncbi:MAG: exonuclease SbcCD subunit D [Oscillospiraceae bacterium]|nr:exonuclease SbcCD subunit D [Oscillospiraceae bacterium]